MNKEGVQKMKSVEKFYDMPMGCYCGVLIREKTAKKLAKLLYKQSQEIKECLASDLNQIEVSDWTIVYPEGNQTSFKFYIESSDKDKIDRINLLDKTELITFCKDGVFIAESYEDAKKVYMEWHEKTNV